MNDISYENALRLLDILAHSNLKEIDIMGGEPFLLSWMPDFIEHAVDKNMRVNISTNGSSTNVLKKLMHLDPEKFTIGISLEGSNEKTHNSITNAGYFRVAVKSIETLVSYNLNPVVKTVLNKRTLHDIQDIINLLIKSGVRRYYLIHMDLFSKEEKDMQDAFSYADFMRFHKRVVMDNPGMEIHKVNASCFEKGTLPSHARCAGGVRKIFISSDGSVFPCNLFRDCSGFYLGNIFTDDFSDIWMSPRLDCFRNFSSNKCKDEDCTSRDSCTGGCPAHGYYHFADPDAGDIRCILKS